MSDNNSSSARILMKAGGETCKATGLALSTTSTLYSMKYLTTAGCSLIEYLPHLFNPDSTINFMAHMAQTNRASWTAVLATILILVAGVVIRKTGTVLTDDKVINRMENFLYRTKSTEEAE